MPPVSFDWWHTYCYNIFVSIWRTRRFTMSLIGNVLIADDNPSVHDTIGVYLRAEGFTYDSAFTGTQAFQLFNKGHYDFIILDIMMPEIFGTEVCREIRKKSDVPIMLLTAKAEEVDRIIGLEIGADDYVVKPFSPKEVVTRIKTILRRFSRAAVNPESDNRIQLGNLEILTEGYKAYVSGVDLGLTPKEFDIFLMLIRNRNRVISREQLLSSVWGYEYLGDTRAVDTHVKRIRKKLSSVQQEGWDLVAVYGVGYKIEEVRG